MPERYTARYQLRHFEDGEIYDIQADHFRFQAIENQIEAFMSVVKGGVIRGWEVVPGDNSLEIQITSGIGIIPFKVREVLIENVETSPNKIEYVDKIDKIFSNQEATKYLGVRTNITSDPIVVPKNTISLLYIGLNEAIVDVLQDPDKAEVEIDFSSSTSLQFYSTPDPSAPAGTSGPYRNTIPLSGTSGVLEYPIYRYQIEGIFNDRDNDATIFVNGKPYYQKFKIEGNIITFDWPLSLSDVVTVRVEPKFSLILAEVETDDSGITRIDNSVRPKIFEIEQDSIVHSALLEHIHDALEGSPEKILLTTETKLIKFSSSVGNKVYRFEKTSIIEDYEFNFGYIGNSSLLNYEPIVYVNGVRNTDPVTIVDNGTQILVTFTESLEDSDIVQLVLRIKDDFTQIEGKLIINDSNPSAEQKEIFFDASKVTEGLLDPNMIPALSHVGVSREALRPTNPVSGEDQYVHRGETRDYREFFPILSKKANAREAKDLFSVPKNTSDKRVYVCGSSTALYYNALLDKIVGDKPEEFFTGWSVLDFDRKIGTGGNDEGFNEFGSPFRVLPFKRSVGINSYDEMFFFSKNFIYSVKFIGDVPQVSEIANLSFDKNKTESDFDSLVSEIQFAVPAKGFLNAQSSVFVAASDQVFLADIKNGRVNWWNITTNSPAWDTIDSLINLREEYSDIESDVLFVGAQTDSDFGLYVNPLGYSLLRNRANSSINGGLNINNFVVEPSSIWDFSSDEKSLFRSSTNDINDFLILSTYNGVSERLSVNSVSYSGSSTPSSNAVFFGAGSGISRDYEGFGSEYNSLFLRDWTLIAEGLSSKVIKVFYFNNRMFILCENDIYFTNDEYLPENSHYLCNEITVPLTTADLSVVSFTPSTGEVYTDAIAVGDTVLVGTTKGIYRIAQTSSVPLEYELESSMNVLYGTTLNELLSPVNCFKKAEEITDNDNAIFVLTKYGVFYSGNAGNTWRNTIQILGRPEDTSSPYSLPKAFVRIVSIDREQNRIYITKSENIYGYGYGYGYLEQAGLNYFDIISLESSTYGFSEENFFDMIYGYGYGFELINPIEGVLAGDWLFTQENSGNIYDNVPIRISSVGLDGSNNLYYMDIEQSDGNPIDFTAIFGSQIFRVYPKIDPLAMINNIPQNSLYDSSDIVNYEVDYYRQSVIFDSEIDEDAEVSIASQFKAFTIIKPFDLESINQSNVSIDFNKLNLEKDKEWTFDSNSGLFSTIYGFNSQDVLRLTVRGAFITDIGSYDHKYIEDQLSLEATGLEYKFDGVRTSNFLLFMMSTQHLFLNEPYTVTILEEGTIDFIQDPIGTNNGFIEDNSLSLINDELVGKDIILNSDEDTRRFTVTSNTSDRIYVQRIIEYENLSDQANGGSTFVFKKDSAITGSVLVYVNSLPIVSFTEVTSGSNVIGIEFSTSPVAGSKVQVAYSPKQKNLLLTSFVEIGDSYKVIEEDSGPYSFLTNTFISRYKDETNFIIDKVNSFVENEILIQNSDTGEPIDALFAVHYNSSTDTLYAGTNKGIWRRSLNDIIYEKTSKLLPTLDATGSITVPNQINGAYIQYNEETKEWTISWGGGTVSKDGNLDLNKVKVTAVAVNPQNSNIAFFSTEDRIFRTFDGGSSFEVIYHIEADPDLSKYPECERIIIDPKAPWSIVAVFREKLLKSIDYGSNWDDISGSSSNRDSHGGISAFSYQKDNSSSSSFYYYGRNNLFLEEYQNKSPLSFRQEDHYSSRMIERRYLFGPDFVDAIFTGIDNYKEDEDVVYLGMRNYGVYKSTILGNSQNLTLNVSRLSFGYGEVASYLNDFTNGNNKTCAFNDIEGTPFSYDIYVDTSNNKTYVSFHILPTERSVPEDGDFVGKYVRIFGSDRSFMRIIEHYDRGPDPGLQGVFGPDGTYYERRLVEFVFEGRYPKKYSGASSAPRFIELSNGDYYYKTGELTSGGVFVLSTLDIPAFAPSNGRTDKIPLVDLGDSVYITKSNLFNSSSKEVTAFIDKAPSSIVGEDLSGYYIGDNQSVNRYKVIESKVLSPSDVYFLSNIYGYGYGYGYGSGYDYFDIIGLSEYIGYGYPFGYGTNDFESEFSNSFGYGFGWALTPYGIGSQIALRLEKIEGGSDDFEFDERNSPLNLWHRYKFTEIHDRDPREFICITDDDDNIIFSGAQIINGRQACYVRERDVFTDGHNQNVIEYRIRPEFYLDFLGIPGSLSGKYIQNISTSVKHLIYDSKLVESGDPDYDENNPSLYLRVEVYGSSKSQSATLFSDGEISSLTSNSITLERSAGLEVDSLKNLGVYFDRNSLRSYRVLSNTSNVITLDSNIIDEIAESGVNLANINGAMQFADVLDLIVDQETGNIYVSTFDGLFYSEDQGRLWRRAFSGLEKDDTNDIPFPEFSKIFISNGYLYSVSNTALYEGVYRLDLNTHVWEKIGGFTTDILYRIDCISLSVFEDNYQIVVYVGSEENALYKGVYLKSSPDWIWTNYSLNSVTAVDAISNHDDLADVDRIWVGTQDRGLFVRDEDQTDWVSFTKFSDIEREIEANKWKVWSVSVDNGFVSVSNLNRTGSSVFDLVEEVYVQDSTESVFDWSYIEENKNETDIIHLITQDPSNAGYLLQEIDPTITSEESRGSHRFFSFLTGISGSEELFKFGTSINGYSLFNFSIGYNVLSMYESPINHLPDFSSIHIIEETSGGNVILGTDKNGLYRTKSSDQQFILPVPSGDHTVINYGFSFVGNNFEDIPFPRLQYYRSYDGRNRIDGEFSYIWERIFSYEIIQGQLPNNGYSEINGLQDYKDLVGSYIVFTRDDVSEISGSNNYVTYIIDNIVFVSDGIEPDKYVLTLSTGRVVTSKSSPSLRSQWGGIYSRWSEDNLPTNASFGVATKFFIVDFERFLPINSGLPTVDVKNEKGQNEIATMIRAISIDSSDNSAAIACGIGGVYTCPNIDAENVIWTKESSLPEMDVTSIVKTNGDIFSGTWGNGVWTNRSGSWASLSDMEHPYIWTLFLNSAEDKIFVGTEHGGIYIISDLSSGIPVREVQKGIIRSQIYLWKTVGVSVRKSSGIDYSDGDKLVSYAWGGGIMQSTDGGSSWSQINSGLENFYVQDISICPDNSSIAYAATCGGGVFKTTNLFSDNPEWNRCSRIGLPVTLNIDEVEVGSNSNVLYVKARENDLSFKNIPFRYRRDYSRFTLFPLPSYNYDPYSGFFLPNNEDVIGKSNGRLKSLVPYENGTRKHTVYRSVDGGISWVKVYDKEPLTENEYTMSSNIFGLHMVPGKDDKVQFLSKYNFDVNLGNSNREFVSRLDYVTIEGGSISSEVQMPSNFELTNSFWGGLGDLVSYGEAHISINPENENEVFIVVQNSTGRAGDGENGPSILRSIDGGLTWNHRMSHRQRPGLTKHTNGVQFSTKDMAEEDIVLTGTNLISSSENILTGIFNEDDSIRPTFFWPRAQDLLLNTDDFPFVSIRFNDPTIFYHTSPEKPINISTGIRPFYLNGASLRPDSDNQTASGLYTVVNGGNSTFLPSEANRVTLLIDRKYVRNTQIKQTNSSLFNITSLIFDYDQIPSNSLLRQEDALIGLDISLSSDGHQTKYKIAIHRFYIDGGNKVQLFIIGTPNISEGMTIRIYPEKPIYVSMFDNVMVSYNKGLSWKHTVSTTEFASAGTEILGIVSFPKEYMTDVSLSDVDRRLFVLARKNNNTSLFYGDVSDDRYNTNIALEGINWTEINLGSNIKNYLEGGITISITDSAQYVYLTQRNRISRIRVTNGVPAGSATQVYGSTDDNLGFNIKLPLVVSPVDQNKMYFIDGNTLKYTANNFTNAPVSYSLPRAINGEAVKDLQPSESTNAVDTLLLSVDTGQSFDTIATNYGFVLESFEDNINILGITQSPNPFLNSTKWIGKIVSFEDSSTGIPLEYTSRIVAILENEINLLPTLRGEIKNSSYDSILNKTTITFQIDNDTIDFNNIDDYRGTILTIQQIRNSETSIYESRVEDIDVVEDLVFNIIVEGNLSDFFSERNIDFINSFAFIRVGRLLDFLSPRGGGKVVSSRISDLSENNGMYVSLTNGNGWSRIESLFYDENDRPSGIKFFGYQSNTGESQSKTAIVSSNGLTRILVNDGWLPSQNIRSIEIANDDSVFSATAGGLVSISTNTLDPDALVFDRFYFNDFESIFSLSADSFIVSDNEGNTYITEKPELDFFGNETLIPTSFSIPKINKAQSDSYGLIWIATNEGLYVINGTNITIFNEDNSDLTSNEISDLVIDGFQRLWLCLGERGISVVDYSFDSEINIAAWTNYDSSFGFSGRIDSVVEKSGLGYIYDGLNSPATATINWTNNTVLTPRSILVRTRTAQAPNIQSKQFDFNPITGQIGSVEEEEINGVAYWKITASVLDNIGTGNIVENSFSGKTILINARENDEFRVIQTNSLNEFYILKNNNEQAPESSKYFMIADSVDGISDSYVVYVDVTAPPSTSFNYIDSRIVEDQIYYYHLYFFSTGSTDYNRIQSKSVTVIDGEQGGENSNLLLFVGPSGIFSYNPQQTISSKLFDSLGNLGVVSEVRSAFVDSSRSIWIAVDNKVVNFVSSDQVTSYDKDDLFSDNPNVSDESMISYDFAENSLGDIYIATNIGLVVIKNDGRTISYIENDSKRVADDSIWRPVLVVDGEADTVIFLEGNEEGRKYVVIGNSMYYTDNKGLSWTLIEEDSNIEYAEEVFDSSGNILEYVFVQNSQIFSSLDSDISDGNFTNIVESTPDVSGSRTVSIPGHINIVESELGKKIYAGLFNHNIVSEEREIAVIDVSSINELYIPTYIGDSEGLSIQSIYSFSEISSGAVTGIFAGGKDCVYFRETGDDAWSTIATRVDGESDAQWAYTSLEARSDVNAFAFGTFPEDKVLLYATRSDLYGSYIGKFNYFDSNVVSIRFKESDLYRNEGGYYAEQTIFSGSSHRDIIWVDNKSLDNYSVHSSNFSYRNSNTLDGHRGAIKFIDGKKTLLVGGFENTLYIIPFTAESQLPRVKPNVSVPARRVNFEESDIPQYSYNQFSFGFGLNNNYASFRLRPTAGWNVSWNSDNDQEGFFNLCLLGQNLNNPKTYYEYASDQNKSWIMKTTNGGQFWYHYPKDGYPNGIVSNMVVDGIETSVSVIAGQDVGVYRFDSVLDQWVEYYSQSIPKAPVKVMVRSGADIFVGPLGFGLYKMSGGVGGYGYGYGGPETMDYFDIISESGRSYGFVEGYSDGVYSYGYGYEVVDGWYKFASRHRTESGFGLAGWHVTSISEDPTNKNRVVIGTKHNGLFEGVFDGVDWVWKSIDKGISSGSISAVKVLNTDPFTIFAGVNDSNAENGMYIRRSGSNSFEKVIDLGLPNTGVISDIQIDTNVRDVYTSFFYTNTVSPSARLVILRAAFESPSTAPDDGIRYQKGSQVANADVVYVGIDDFSSDAFIDDDKSLRPGVPYFYRFFKEEGLYYEEIGAISGETSTVNERDIVLGTSSLSGKNKVGNICRIFNPLNGIGFSFKIQSHTDNQIFFETDPFGVINKGTTSVLEIEDFIDYTVQSTIVAIAVISNPIYVISNGDIYLTIDNGRSWVNRNAGIDVDVNSLTPVVQNNVLESTVLSTILYASAIDGVFKSNNSGVSWTRISEDIGVGYNGLPNGKNYLKVWVDPNETNIVYALEETGEIYRTVNDGEVWELVISSGSENLNVTDFVPDSTNIIYLGFDKIGLQKFADSIRDTLYVEIEANGRITEFDVDYFEMGDKFYTDSNSILAKTIVKNDLVSDTREQIRLKVSDETDLITFKFRKNNSLFDIEDIVIGDVSTNPYTNPFVLSNPSYNQDNIVINKIGNITEEEVFAITNKGLYTSVDKGDKWVRENSAVVPSNIFDVGVARNGEILLATEGKGLWTSSGDRRVYRNIEQDGADVRTVWETRVGGTRRIFRGGTRGLYVTSEKPSSRSIIVYSGPTFNGGKSIEFSWGDLLNPNDGGWSDSTIRTMDIPLFAFRQPGGQLQTYDGWDEALIVRRGPYATLEKAQNDALSNDVFAPINRVQFPYNRAVDDDRIYRTTSSSLNLEELRDINDIGDGAVGVSLDPPAYMSGGNIIVGVFKNTSDIYPSEDSNYPSTDKPIIDRVEPNFIDAGVRAANGMPVENFADEDAYSPGEERLPVLKENRFYIYRIYPYRNVPSPDFVKGVGDNVVFPLHPRYLPSTGDLVDSYSYIVDIKKFSGASNIISVSANIDGNWIVGTDVGVFWSTQEGSDVVQSLVIQRETSSVFISSSGLVLAAVVGSTRLEVYSNSKELTDSNFDSSWSFLTELVTVLENSGANRIYGFDEDENGIIYAATNKGIFQGNSDGTNWIRSDSVGDLESLRSGKAIGQEFVIES